jgi:acetate CoA/acetoacetate CoA-transferase alpha subunit
MPDGASVMVGGFLGIGTPEQLMDELVRQRRKDLTVIVNDTAVPGAGVGKLIAATEAQLVVPEHVPTMPIR